MLAVTAHDRLGAGGVIMATQVPRCRVNNNGRLVVLVLGVVLILAATATPALAPPVVNQKWWVSESGSDSGSGTSTAAPFRTITHALSVASAGDTVMIGPSTYSTATGETLPLASNGVSLKSTDGSATTIVDGGGVHQGLSIDNPLDHVELSGITFRNCSDGPGCAVMIYGSSAAGWPLIAECGFVDNFEPDFDGAALYIFGDAGRSGPRVEYNYFARNRTVGGSGGAIFLGNYTDATIAHNIFDGNAGYNGGAIMISLSQASEIGIRDNIFAGNESTFAGGAICCYANAPATLTITGNSLTDNESLLGGALRFDIDAPGGATVTNNDAGGNEASDGGGFAWVERGNMVSVNNAIGGNHAGRGAAWYINGGTFTERNDTVVHHEGASSAIDAHDSADIDIVNCILWNPLLAADVEHADSVSFCCLYDAAAASRDNTIGAGMIYSDPLFANPASHTIELAATSPCIDSANTAEAPDADFYGTIRPIDGNEDGTAVADVGAYERKIATAMTFAAPSTCEYGSAKVTGTLKTAAANGLSGRTVMLEYSYDGFATVAGSRTATTTSSGTFSYAFAPKRKTYYRASYAGDSTHSASNKVMQAVLPRVYLARPSVKTTMVYGRSYTASGYLKPQHASGSKPVRILLYKKKGSSYVLSSKHYHAKVKHYKGYSKYYVSVKLPSRGRWRLRAYHPADSLHASTKSAYRSVTVK